MDEVQLVYGGRGTVGKRAQESVLVKGIEVQNIPPPHRFQKRKNWTCRESMLSLSLAAWNFLSPYLAWANGMEQPQKRKKKKFPPPKAPPQKEGAMIILYLSCLNHRITSHFTL